MNSPGLSATLRQQYDALTEGAGWCAVGARTQIELTGKDHALFLHNLCTGDIKPLRSGGGCEAFFTTVQGKTLALAHVFRNAESLVVETEIGLAEMLMAHLDRYLIREDVQLHDRSQSWGEFLVSGAGVERRLMDLQIEVPEHPLDHVLARVGNVSVWLRRVRMTGPFSWLISTDAEQLDVVTHALSEAGFAPCQPEAMNIVRVESGWPVFGQDVTDQNLPQEVDRNDMAVSFTKGCYLGQETVARIDAVGHVNRKLVGVKFAGAAIPDVGMRLSWDDQQVGQVTSSVFSPRLDSPLALAYVRRARNAPGTRLQSEVGDAEVVSLPVN